MTDEFNEANRKRIERLGQARIRLTDQEAFGSERNIPRLESLE